MNIHRRRCITILVAVSMLLAHAGAAIAPSRPSPIPDTIQRSFRVPLQLGRVTAEKDFGSPSRVVLIQDLHCHPGVQRNIRDIVAWCDSAAPLSRVLVEGAAGAVDTSWLASIRDEQLRAKILEALVDSGYLTGSEYYAVASGKTRLIEGLEEPALYAGNLGRLGRILDERPVAGAAAAALENKLAALRKTGYGSALKRIDRWSAQYAAGKLSAAAYYRRLIRVADKETAAYPQVAAYLAAEQSSRQFNQRKLNDDVVRCLGRLKTVLPYAAYAQLVRDNGGRPVAAGELIDRLAQACAERQVSLETFPHLARYIHSRRMQAAVNPAALVSEENRLVRDAYEAVCSGPRERDIVFLADTVRLLRLEIDTRLSADEYAVLAERRERFAQLWERYTGNDAAARLLARLRLWDDFYRVNNGRNEAFVSAITASPGNIAAVAGGYHVEAVARLLEERKISYAIVTPQVPAAERPAEAAYNRIAREQTLLRAQAFAVAVCSAEDKPRKLLVLASALATARDRFGGWEGVRRALETVQKDGSEFDGLSLTVVPGNGEDGGCRVILDNNGSRETWYLRNGVLVNENNSADPDFGSDSGPSFPLPSGVRRYVKPFVVTIDGQSGSGKTYIAVKLARRLGALFVSYGKLYRLAALLMLEENSNPGRLSPRDAAGHRARAAKLAGMIDISKFTYRYIDGEIFYYYGGRHITETLFATRVSSLARELSADADVQAMIASKLREYAAQMKRRGVSVVTEGRATSRETGLAADARIFLETTPDNATAHRARQLFTKHSLRQAYFAAFGESATEQEFQDASLENSEIELKQMIEQKINEIITLGQDDDLQLPRDEDRNDMFVIEKDHGLTKEQLFEIVNAEVQRKVFPSLAPDFLQLPRGPERLDASFVRSLESRKNWTRPGGWAGSSGTLQMLTAGKWFSGRPAVIDRETIAGALAEAAQALPEPLRKQLKESKGSLRVATFPAEMSRNLFECGRFGTDHFYILVSEGLAGVRDGAGNLTDILLELGLANGLARMAGDGFPDNTDLLWSLARNRARRDGTDPAAVRRFLERAAALLKQPAPVFPEDLRAAPPGSYPIRKTVVISDLHGAFSRSVSLLSAAIGHPLHPGTVFEELDLLADDLHREGIRILINGDIPDRGPETEQMFLLVRKLVRMGIGSYVTGNHDVFAFMNLLGLHLPWYPGFKGIGPDYEGYRVGNVVRLLEEKRAANAEGIDNIHHWAKKLTAYMKYVDALQKKRDASGDGLTSGDDPQGTGVFKKIFAGLYGYSADMALDDKKGKDVLNNASLDKECRFFKARPGEDGTAKEALLRWWKLVLGRDNGLVYTGIRGVDKMSINWWEDRLREAGEFRKQHPEQEASWAALETAMKNFIAEQQAKTDEELAKGNWEWSVLDAIMYRNYESMEWWALDWVYHSGWGGLKNGFLAQLNDKLAGLGYPAVSTDDYLGVPRCQQLRDFYMANFRFYSADIMPFLVMHGFLPVDNQGHVCIGRVDENGDVVPIDEDGTPVKGLWYKGVQYRDAGIFDAFDRMSADIRNFRYGVDDISAIREALAIYMYIYADKTTRIRPKDIKKYTEIVCSCGKPEGCERCGGNKGIGLILHHLRKSGRILMNGHNIMEKVSAVDIPTMGVWNNSLFGQADGSMAPVFGGNGIVWEMDEQGLWLTHHVFDTESVQKHLVIAAGVLADTLKGVLRPGAAVFAIAEESVRLARTPDKPSAGEMARLYVEQTQDGWGVVHVRDGRLFYDTSIDENLRSFMIAGSSYYRATPPSKADIDKVLALVDVSVDAFGRIEAVLKIRDVPSVPPAGNSPEAVEEMLSAA